MQFPVYIPLGPWRVHPHPVMEGIAYIAALTMHYRLRRAAAKRGQIPAIDPVAQLWILAGAAIGALIGSQILSAFESWPGQIATASFPSFLFLNGKTVVGGLIGAWTGVEIAKRANGVRQRTGDTWVLPLCLSMAIGRIGCFLTGLDDHTYGLPSNLPWAINFGDNIPRHPTQLYDIAFLLLLMIPLAWLYKKSLAGKFPPGATFRLFMLAYCAYRFAIEFLKPSTKNYAHLSAIQWTCLAAVTGCLVGLGRKPPTPIPAMTQTQNQI